MDQLTRMATAGALVLGVLGSLGAGCAAPPSDSTDTASLRATEGADSGLPAGFDVWFREQCPDGRTLRVTSETGVQVDTTCKDAREEALADASLRDGFVSAYLVQTEEPMKPSGERIGETQERWSPLGLLCGMFMWGITYIADSQGCHNPHSQYPAGCSTGVNVGLGLGGTIACAFL